MQQSIINHGTFIDTINYAELIKLQAKEVNEFGLRVIYSRNKNNDETLQKVRKINKKKGC